ncbi:DUF6202 family protein [Amycolatopsis sp. NPDC051061]|uniref:DUF6202 family protein n=1 Tax=Amycolatopsis sp. NPDC051061 TaxID=3155042 RepID=UPI00343321DF
MLKAGETSMTKDNLGRAGALIDRQDTAPTLDDQVNRLIDGAGLNRENNEFFHRARHCPTVTPEAAYTIAATWGRMTRSFMFTTIASLGLNARRFAMTEEPNHLELAVFQTAYRVIGDDVANFAGEFAAVGPQGAAGIHYVWWHDTVTARLAPHAGEARTPGVPAGARVLLASMARLADEPLGAAVQLRVVEHIALDIAVAFRRVCTNVVVDGAPLFARHGDLDWIDSHIRAETGHAASVSDDETGMTTAVAPTPDRDRFVALVAEYVASWAGALDEFARVLPQADGNASRE